MMTKFVILIFILFCHFSVAQAQIITGKWKCTKEYLAGLRTGYEEMKGYYKFRRDGTFKASIRGRGLRHNKYKRSVNTHRAIYITIRGTYSVTDGAITTVVAPNDIKCTITTGSIQPSMPSAQNATRSAVGWYEFKERRYRDLEYQKRTQLETVRRELTPRWNWSKESTAVTENTITVNGEFVLTR